jgi:methylated-DNA-protein-cysteine methyltransferase related protein
MEENLQEMPLFERIYATVRRIPPGRVATYGQIARMVSGCSAQMIGFALAALRGHPGEDVPWQRVINRMGKISPHGFGYGSALQRDLLEGEGVEFDEEGCIDLERFGWS